MLEVISLKNILGYQEKAIVSREILKKEKGGVTFFSFDKDEGLKEHTAPFDAFVYVLEGQMEISISSISYTLNQDEAIIMPANESHSLKAKEKSKMLLVMIKE